MKRMLVLVFFLVLILSGCENRETIQGLTQIRGELESEVAQLSEENEALARERAELKRDYADLEERIVALEAERDALQGQIENDLDAQLRLVENNLERRRSEVETLESQRRELEERIGALSGEEQSDADESEALDREVDVQATSVEEPEAEEEGQPGIGGESQP